MKSESREVSLILSGGGARGMAHIGVIKGLQDSGYNITSIAGTSIGALIGGIFLTGKLDEFVDWVTGVSKFDILKFMDFAISKNGFIKGEKIFKKLKPFITDVHIEDLRIPYTAVAVDILNHKEVVFNKGPLINAIRASVSIPTVMKPFNFDGRELVDGGVLNPLPLDLAQKQGNNLVVAVDLNSDIPYFSTDADEKNNINIDNSSQTYEKALQFINKKWSKYFGNGKNKSIGFFDLVTQSIYAMQMKLTQVAIDKYKPEMVVSIAKSACDIFEFHRAEELIDYGYRQFSSELKKYKIDK
jgi:NTE family protein